MWNEKCKERTAFSVFFLIFFIFTFASAFAEEDGFTSSTELELQITSMPEAKIRIIQNFGFPFLQGESFLTKDNTMTVALSADITPVSLFGIGEAAWTPVAFFVLSGGGKAGSGWNIPLGNGIGINAPEDKNAPVPGPEDAPRKAKIYGDTFDGLIWSGWGAGTLQFDLGALIPGDWTHVLFQTRHEFRYSAYTRAGSSDSWILDNDDGDNKNGWEYCSSYVLGYLMPQSPVLNLIALMAELEKPLYHTPGEDFWGGDLGKWVFSGLFNFSVNTRLNLTLAIQMRTRRNLGLYNFNDDNYYYQDIQLEKNGGPRHAYFHRAALIFNYKIR